MSRLYKHKISVQGSTPTPTSDRAITLSRLYKHKISAQGSTPNPTSEFFFSIGSIYVFIYLFHNTQCIVFELTLQAENQWHHDHSINQTLNSKQEQHWLKLSISELMPLSPFKKPKQICSTNWNQQF